jgi:RNA polymerase primary sigma factor
MINDSRFSPSDGNGRNGSVRRPMTTGLQGRGRETFGESEDIRYFSAQSITITPVERKVLAASIFQHTVQEQECLARFPIAHEKLILKSTVSEADPSEEDAPRSNRRIVEDDRSKNAGRNLQTIGIVFAECVTGRTRFEAYRTAQQQLAATAWDDASLAEGRFLSVSDTKSVLNLLHSEYALATRLLPLLEFDPTELLLRARSGQECSAFEGSAGEQVRMAAIKLMAIEDRMRMPLECFRKQVETLQRISARLIQLKEKMQRANTPLAITVVHRYRESLTLGDAIQEASIGLMQAIENFNPGKGFQFSTFAVSCIRNALRRAENKESPKANLTKSDWTLVNAARATMKLNGRDDDRLLEDAAAKLDVEAEKLGALLKRARSRPIQMPFSAFEDPDAKGSLVEGLVVSRAPRAPEVVEKEDTLRKLLEFVNLLEPRMRDVLIYRFGLEDGEPKTLEEVGQRFGVTRERIRQIETAALPLLREGLESGMGRFLDAQTELRQQGGGEGVER